MRNPLRALQHELQQAKASATKSQEPSKSSEANSSRKASKQLSQCRQQVLKCSEEEEEGGEDAGEAEHPLTEVPAAVNVPTVSSTRSSGALTSSQVQQAPEKSSLSAVSNSVGEEDRKRSSPAPNSNLQLSLQALSEKPKKKASGGGRRRSCSQWISATHAYAHAHALLLRTVSCQRMPARTCRAAPAPCAVPHASAASCPHRVPCPNSQGSDTSYRAKKLATHPTKSIFAF